MTHLITFPVTTRVQRKRPGILARLLDAVRPRRRATLLDLDSAPEHMLRDLGFVDGRGGDLRHPAWPYNERSVPLTGTGWR